MSRDSLERAARAVAILCDCPEATARRAANIALAEMGRRLTEEEALRAFSVDDWAGKIREILWQMAPLRVIDGGRTSTVEAAQ